MKLKQGVKLQGIRPEIMIAIMAGTIGAAWIGLAVALEAKKKEVIHIMRSEEDISPQTESIAIPSDIDRG